MGIESFFLECIDVDTTVSNGADFKVYSGNSKKTKKDFLEFLKSNGYRITKKEKFFERYVINKTVFMDIFLSENNYYFQGFSLEGCFSNFNDTIDFALNIIQTINSKFIPLKLRTWNNEYEIFEKIDLKVYLEKIDMMYKQFIREYGCLFKSLPGKEFYKKYRKWHFFHKS